MKVLHLLMSNKFSGAENVVCQIIENCTGYEMAYCSPQGQIEEELKKRGIRYIPLDKKNIKSIKKAVELYKPDIIHAHDFTASVLVAQIKFKGKIISHLHNNPPFIKKWGIKSILYNSTIDQYDKVILVSNSIYEEAVFKKKLKKKYSVIYNYINAENIIEKSKEQSEIKSDIVFIGRLTEQKDPLGFIDIVKNIKKDIPDVKSVMLGDGELKEECIKKIQQEGLEKNIEILGFVDNPYCIIKNTKLLIMPSKWEGFGLVAIEAMILDKLVLAAEVGGLKEIFQNNKEFLFDINSDMIEKAVLLLKDNKEYEKEKEKLPLIIDKYIDSKSWTVKLEEIYDELNSSKLEHPIKVLQYTPAFDVGGVESFIINMYDNLDKEKVQFDFLIEDDIDEKIRKDFEEKGAKIYQIPKMTAKKQFWNHIKELNEFLEKSEYKTIHCHGTYTRPILLLLARLKGIPVVFHSHTTSDIEQKNKLLRKVLKKVCAVLSTHYLACSREAAEFCFGKKKAKKTVTIKNAIDIEKYRYNEDERNKIRRELGLEDSFVIGHVGRFVEVKNHSFIIEVFDEIKKKIPNLKLLLVGDGELLGDIKDKVEELDLQNDVIFLGRRNDIENIMQAMDVFIFPSLFEGLPLTGVEAQASGLKIIASDNISKEMRISDLVDFISLKKGASEWAEKIIALKDYQRRDMYLDLIDSEYNIKKSVKKLEEFYINL